MLRHEIDGLLRRGGHCGLAGGDQIIGRPCNAGTDEGPLGTPGCRKDIIAHNAAEKLDWQARFRQAPGKRRSERAVSAIPVSRGLAGRSGKNHKDIVDFNSGEPTRNSPRASTPILAERVVAACIQNRNAHFCAANRLHDKIEINRLEGEVPVGRKFRIRWNQPVLPLPFDAVARVVDQRNIGTVRLGTEVPQRLLKVEQSLV